MCEYFFIGIGYVATIVLILINGIFSWFKYFKYDYKDNLIVNIIEENLKDKLLDSFAFRQICKDGEEKLILGKWDGTIDGCECEVNIFKEKCSNEKLESGCRHLFSMEPINYTFFNSSNICVKRSKLNYGEYLKSKQVIPNNKECPVDYNKYCGIIDSLGKKLCIKEGETCPISINDIKQNFYSFFEKDNISNDGKLLLTSIKIFQYLPCIYPLEKYWNYYYCLEPSDQRCTTEIKGELYDERYKKLFNYSINKLQLYTENLIINKLKLNEEDLNKMKNDELFLFGRNFLGFDTKVAHNYNYDNLISNQKKSNKCNLVLKIWTVSLVLIFILVFALSCFSNIKVSTNKIVDVEAEVKMKKLRKNLWIIGCILFFLSHIFYFIINLNIYKYNKKIKSILNVKGDEVFNELVKTLINDISINYKYSLAIIIVSPFIFVLLCVSLGVCGKRLEENEKKEKDDNTKEKNLINNDEEDD